MNLSRKLELARQAVASITRHDDATFEERFNTIEELRTFMAAEMMAAQERARLRGNLEEPEPDLES